MPDNPNSDCQGFRLIIAARDRSDLTGTEFAVFCALASHKLNFKPTVTQIARGAKVSLRSAHRSLVRLKELGMVAPVNSGNGGRSQQQRYVPVVPKTLPQSPSIPETLPLCPENSATESDSEEKSQREDSGLRPAAVAAPPIPIPVPPVQQLFSRPLLDRLIERTGRSEKQVRSLLGMAHRDLGAGQALEIAVGCLDSTTPWDWLTAAYHKRMGQRRTGRARTNNDGSARDLLNAFHDPDFEYSIGVPFNG
jgi:hypothetical protein